MTGHHETCLPKLEYYDKVWYCTCEQCHPDMATETEEDEADE